MPFVPVSLDSTNDRAHRQQLALALSVVQRTTAGALQAKKNLSDLDTVATARTNLGLGSAAVEDVGTAAGNVVQLDSGAKLPAVDGSQLTNLPCKVVQVIVSETGDKLTGTTVIPFDDTIPQSNEGDEYMSVSITPKSATSILLIEAVGNFANSGGFAVAMALFQDSGANALAVSTANPGGANGRVNLTLRHKLTAGSTAATTFKVRAGASSASTTTFNGDAGGREFGGVYASSITITEVLA